MFLLVAMQERNVSRASIEQNNPRNIQGLSPFCRHLLSAFPLFLPENNKHLLILAEPCLHRYHLFAPQLVHATARAPQNLSLVLTPHGDDLKDMEDFLRFQLPEQTPIPLLSLGTLHSMAREEGLLSSFQGIILSSPERLIDHLRRNTFPTLRLTLLVVDCPTSCDLESFLPDLEFFFSKRNQPPPTLVVSELPLESLGPLRSLLRKYRVIRGVQGFPVRWFEYPASLSIQDSLLLLAKHVVEVRKGCTLYHSSKEVVEGLKAEWKEGGPFSRKVFFASAESTLGDPMVLRYPFVFLHPPGEEELTAVCKVFLAANRKPYLCILGNDQEKETLIKLQERTNVDIKHNILPAEEESLKNLVERLTHEVRASADPKELQYYRKFISKHVSFFLRPYFSAYLLKLLHQSLKEGEESGTKNSDRTPMTPLFFSMGKNRKIFPRDWSALICGTPGFQKSDIGEIKILDNYSFVEISSEKAPLLIERLNGTEFKGKKLTVNYARKKEGAQKTETSPDDPREDSEGKE